LALLDNAAGRVLIVDLTQPGKEPVILRTGLQKMTTLAVSPDGRWLAIGNWKSGNIQVWSVPRRRLERLLPAGESAFPGDISSFVAFTPDGRRLVSTSHSSMGHYSWEVGTWERRLLIEGNLGASNQPQPPCFTRDGRLMAVMASATQILLAETATGREVARLSTLERLDPTPLAFSPDGTYLVAATKGRFVQLWDLRHVRGQLASLGLDVKELPEPLSTRNDVAGPLPPPRPVRVSGAVLEPEMRRQAEAGLLAFRLLWNPLDANAYLERGRLHLGEKRWSQAVADLEQAVALLPGHAYAHRTLAEAYLGRFDLKAAQAALSRHLERAPEDTEARLERGQLALELGQPEQAADDFTKVLAAEPSRDLARSRRAQAYIRLGRIEEALADFDALLKDSPKPLSLYYLRADLHERLGNRAAAVADREKGQALLPKNPMALNNGALQYVTAPEADRDPERALPLAEKAVELAPAESMYRNTLGVVFYRLGRFGDARATLEKSLELGKGRWDASDLFFLAMCHHYLGDAGRARDCYDRAVKWRQEKKDLSAEYAEELAAFQAEADAVLSRGNR
jgi:tetratricopeptide (TPR) repeat protein